jgi:hypothetical protein
MQNKSLVVFCGSSDGKDHELLDLAAEIGKYLAENKISLIYGGAKIGVMGRVADGVLNNGGNVVGIIPDFLMTKEIVHPDLSELIIVETMQERKKLMHKRSDACLTLPGGFGTLDELFEFLTWKQLNLLRIPIGLLNTNGFYDKLLDFIEIQLEYGFIRKEHLDLFMVSKDYKQLISHLLSMNANGA